MSLSPGDRLGRYEIVEPIGAGGMGEVYKARDTRLNRIIAIKTSAEQFSERFEREARAVAALNHPNICTLYDVGPDYLVMEYIDGQPLKGPLSLDQALRSAGQILDALDAAHRKGIVHRDLKPANILVTKSGIKLLDFGLAKQSSAAAAGATETIALTKQHSLLGTLQYMSPEQLEGKEADSRSDIFSFGMVFHEMLTGRYPYQGGSPASIIAAILEREAPSLGNVAPAALDRVLQRCLSKNPDERWQTARDLKAALQIGEAAPAATPSARINPWRARAGWIAAAAAMAVLVAFLALTSWRKPPAAELVRFNVYPPDGTVFARTNSATIAVPQFALSPNGRALAFAAAAGEKSALWVRSLDQTEVRQIPGTDGALGPFWSPDSMWIGFFVQGAIKKVPATGGAVQTIVENVIEPRGASWVQDEVILYAEGGEGLRLIPAAGGRFSSVTSLEASREERAHRWPRLLPDGGYLFTIRSGVPQNGGIYGGSMDGRTKKQLVPGNSSGVYSSPGYLLWVEDNTLVSQSFDAAHLTVSGRPFTVAEGVGRSTASESAISVGSGVLAYSGAMMQEGRLTWFDRAGTPLDSPVTTADYVDSRLSPDGSRLATSVADPKTGVVNIWMTDLNRHGRPERFTTDTGGVSANAIWSSDGSQLIFRTNRSGLIELHQKSALGGRNEVWKSVETLTAAGINAVGVIPLDWSKDGRNIMVAATGRGSGYDLWLIPWDGTVKPSKFLGSATASDEIQANFSPNGLLVAYASNETGRFETYIRTLKPPDQRLMVSTGGGYEPRWRADGREMYYLSEDRKLMAVSVGEGLTVGVPKTLFQTKVAPGVDAYRTHYVPAGDGQRFLINVQNDPVPHPITVVLNWTAGLRKQ